MNRFSHCKQPDRRVFLRGFGVSLALPMLESLQPAAIADERGPTATAKRFVCVAPDYGIYPQAFFPRETGRNYKMPDTLKMMERHREDMTVFSHLDHPGVGGGHACTRTFMNGMKASDAGADRSRLLSLDQLIARNVGMNNRFPALVTGNGAPISYTEAGIPVPSVPTVDRFFNLLFVDEDANTKNRQRKALDDNASILDVLLEDSRSLQPQLASQDRDKLEEYLTAVRETERKLVRRKDWIEIPKPNAKPPKQDEDESEQSGYPYDMSLFFEIMVLALQTESTRVLTYQMPGGNRMFPFDGVTMGYHTLTHHGKDPEKASQIQVIDRYYLTQLAGFVDRLKKTKDQEGRSMLESTIVLFGSGMGNASAHSSRDVPVLVAGGGLRHGNHHSFPKDAGKETPLSDLYVTLLKQLGIETDRFSSSSGDLDHLLS
ncbi:MAG: hypothetical protein CBB71_06555 [Rhodopirellula sp. TMED11]|nr:MAG: hypothetical protein CBB71_06555 [Rhodopirellula sp. TMED11]